LIFKAGALEPFQSVIAGTIHIVSIKYLFGYDKKAVGGFSRPLNHQKTVCRAAGKCYRTDNTLRVIVNGLGAKMDPADPSGLIRPDTTPIVSIAAGIEFQTGIFRILNRWKDRHAGRHKGTAIHHPRRCHGAELCAVIPTLGLPAAFQTGPAIPHHGDPRPGGG
jgi:hypothetical protein